MRFKNKTAAKGESLKNKSRGHKTQKVIKMAELTMTRKDLINAKSASIALQEAPETLTVVGATITSDVDENGEVKKIGYIVASDGKVYGTISETAQRAISDIMDYAMDEHIDCVDIEIIKRKSKGGREFITISLI